MTWQDLKDDLGAFRDEVPGEVFGAIEEVGRRVLALFQPCPNCEGVGWWHPQPAIDGDRVTCPRCSGAGAIENEPFPMPYGATFGRIRYARLLARHLFAGEA